MKPNWMIPRRIRNSGITTSENSTRLWPRWAETGRRRDRRRGRSWTRTGERDLDDSTGMDPSSLSRTGSHGYESLVIPDVPLPYAVGVITILCRGVVTGGGRSSVRAEMERAFEAFPRLVVPFHPHARLPSRRPVRAHRRPAAGDRPPRRRPPEGPQAADAAGRDGHREDLHDREDDRGPSEADARPCSQQDARRPALRGVPGVLSR